MEKLAFDLQIHNALPDSFFGKKAIEEVFYQAQIVLDAVNNENLDLSNFVFSENKMLNIKHINDITPKDWFISGELAWYNKDYADTKQITTFELSTYETVLNGYLTSLLLLATLPEEDTEQYTITMYDDSFNYTYLTANIISHTYTATPEQARVILNKIYREMFISQFHICAPLSMIQADIADSGNEDKEPYSFSDFKNDLQDDRKTKEWAYFSKKDFFNIDTDLGYTDANFEDEWSSTKLHQMELMKFLGNISKENTVSGE